MFIFTVIPLAYIPRPSPQILSYFYPEQLEPFSLVEVLLGKARYAGVVINGKEVKDMKLILRNASFQVKPINRVLVPDAIIYSWQYELAQWIADYYWSSLGLVMKKFIPSYLMTKRNARYDLPEKGLDKQALFLFPDASFFQKTALPRDIVAISSQLTKKSEFQLFEEIASGNRRNITGTKRALFAPYNNLEEIYIFEEADTNHASWDQRPRYHAVDVARKLAFLHDATITYHSTVPSLASYIKKRPFLSLEPSIKKGEVYLLDLTQEKLQKPFSEILQLALRDCYVHGRQALLYMNRRGEGRFILCRDCGFSPHCPNCDLSLTLHGIRAKTPKRRLLCHHCGHKSFPPSKCSQCGSHEVRAYGFGTQRVTQELRTLFPKAKIFRLDSDIAPNQRAKQEILDRFETGGNFLVTTSMIFQSTPKKVELVAALNPDTELNIPDFAQQERLFFNLWRLQRWVKQKYYIQTYNPKSSLLSSLAKHSWRSFYKQEASMRKALNYPPFSSIIKIEFAHRNEAKVKTEATVLIKKIKRQMEHVQINEKHIQLLGPSPAFIYRLKGEYRYHILIKIKTNSLAGIEQIKTDLLSTVPSNWDVNVDPVDSL